jgi:GxxExxY protein
MTRLRHEKLTYDLRGLIFEVRKKLKTGWSEEIYHQALVQLLRDKGIPVHSKPRKPIIHRGIEV